ncbi:tRNA (Adenine-N(1)-)-methyltransferase non-catalytic subunittrm6 [Zostera marina]|uniref:tRNA (adenine(58)-N(1))-methyltransferase non-catalytic subunit TRM6 n=1 Tax=Zostera marina TaxID=29655 RepID=A0A0K9PPV2_ZOSMR|nr:tRNA (Adenine-N(1)-)-methyltransferase non-catalytic subunittrm6 [Zostera marina]
MEEGNTTNAHEDSQRVTWEGCSVLLDVNDGDRFVFARLTTAATLSVGSYQIPLGPLIGRPFGSLFQMRTGPDGPFLIEDQSKASSDSQHTNGADTKENGMDWKNNQSKDNRALNDTNTAQNLQHSDIVEMKREGVSGDQIIEALISNSSTFAEKTVFSQEKYKIKKQKKFAPKVLLRRPWARSICEAYLKKKPVKIGYLRFDTLSLMLASANVSGYSDVLVVDQTGGMVTGAVAERLGSTGNVCCTYLGLKSYPIDIVKIFNFSPDLCSRILQSPLPVLSSVRVEDTQILQNPVNSIPSEIATTNSLLNSTPSQVSMTNSPLNPTPSQISMTNSPLNPRPSQIPITCADIVKIDVSSRQSIPSPKDHLEETSDCTDMNLKCTDKAFERRKVSCNPGQNATQARVNLWKERGFTSLIIAAPNLDLDSLVEDLLPLLTYSAPFVIYHQFLQPLAVCMKKLMTSKIAIALRISEPFIREYQVLPGRTHPFMEMNGFGGYILSGIRVQEIPES